MRKLSAKLFVSGLVLLQGLASFADGLVADGHVAGPYTNLKLTAIQKVALLVKMPSITLTAEQKSALRSVPRSANVKELMVFPSNAQTCTCELANVAVRVSDDTIEVPHSLLGRDLIQEARDNEKRWQEEKDQKYAAWHTRRGSKELLLCEQAESISFKSPQGAIPLYEQALQINPHLEEAKVQLAIALNNYGLRKQRAGNLGEALGCFKKALLYMNRSHDPAFYQSTEKRIRELNTRLSLEAKKCGP